MNDKEFRKLIEQYTYGSDYTLLGIIYKTDNPNEVSDLYLTENIYLYFETGSPLKTLCLTANVLVTKEVNFIYQHLNMYDKVYDFLHEKILVFMTSQLNLSCKYPRQLKYPPIPIEWYRHQYDRQDHIHYPIHFTG